MIEHAQIITVWLDKDHPVQLVFHYPTNTEELFVNSAALYPLAVSAGLLPDGIGTIFTLWFVQFLASQCEMEYVI
jgi:hypothetical protein